NGEHIVEVVRDSTRKLTDSLHLLRLPQLFFGPKPLRNFVSNPLFQFGVQGLQFCFGTSTLHKFALRSGEEACIVDSGCRMACDSQQGGFVLYLETPWLRMTKKKPS